MSVSDTLRTKNVVLWHLEKNQWKQAGKDPSQHPAQGSKRAVFEIFKRQLLWNFSVIIQWQKIPRGDSKRELEPKFLNFIFFQKRAENPKGRPFRLGKRFFRTENSEKHRLMIFDFFSISCRAKGSKKSVSLFGLVYFCGNQMKIVHSGIRTHAHALLFYSRCKYRLYRNLSVRLSSKKATTIVCFF